MDQIPNILACDVGNTTIRLACVNGDEIGPIKQLKIGDLSGLGDVLDQLWAHMPNPKTMVACSVNPTGLKALEAAAAEVPGRKVLVIGTDLPLPIEMDLPHPESVGADRICCAVAAYDQLGVACVVADFGTAITVDCVSGDGVFLGGAILPGIKMGAAGLAEKTAALPKVTPTNPDWVFGKDTAQAIIGGLVFGARGALRCLVESYATQLGHWPVVIATGGDAELVCADRNVSDMVQAIVPELTLRGAAIAYYRTLAK